MNLKAFLKISSSQLEMITQAIDVRNRIMTALPFPVELEPFWVKYRERTYKMISIKNHFAEIIKEGNDIISTDLADLEAVRKKEGLG